MDTVASSLTREDLDVGHPRFFPVLPALVAAALDDGGSVDHLVEGDERRRRSSNRRINFCYSRPEDVSLARCLLRAWRWRKTEERGWERAYGRARMVRTGVSWAPPPLPPPPLPLNLFLLLPPRGGRLSRLPAARDVDNWNGGVRVLDKRSKVKSWKAEHFFEWSIMGLKGTI